MRRTLIALLVALAGLAAAERALAQPVAIGSELKIAWEVKNRFRLFRHESDFQRHVAAERGDGILAAERRLAQASDGHGWARLTLNSLCVDAAGRVLTTCDRDGVRENYLTPTDHPVSVTLPNAPAGAQCAWRFEAVDEQPREATVPCGEPMRLRVRHGTPTIAVVDVASTDGAAQRATAEILVRDLLIAGIGDSIASGEGNPDRAIVLTDEAFCFRRVLGGAGREYFRPGRAGFRGAKSCELTGRDDRAAGDWAQQGANWMSAACHRSLYSYQVRTALALAIENPHVTVTFIPLACTGAEIQRGLFEARRAREITCGGRGRTGPCPSSVPPQIAQMNAVLEAARRAQPNRAFDLVLLTVGANDIRFSELVADVMLDGSTERTLFARGGGVANLEEARNNLQRRLPGDFAKLRAALKPLVGGDLARVVYVSYAHPAAHDGGAACPGGRDGVDIHPAFAIDAERMRAAADFVQAQFLPALRALALCEGGVLCKDAADRMTFVDAHQRGFLDRGFCARADSDPAFDRACFSPAGESFHKSLREAAQRPLVCDRSVREFRPYAARARWIRTPNDSYFTAMTYPDGLPTTMQPADIHDALWGVLSAVYGGAIHPTAEGHAAMADAALPAARQVLGFARAAEPEVDLLPTR